MGDSKIVGKICSFLGKSFRAVLVICRKVLARFSLSFMKMNTLNKDYHILFIPHKDYHAKTMYLIWQNLRESGLDCAMIDILGHYPDEGVQREMKDKSDMKMIPYVKLKHGIIKGRCIVCMNDWEHSIIRPLLESLGKSVYSVGIIEGINDFLDLDTGMDRKPYQTVDKTLLTGRHDMKFFSNAVDEDVIGIPRLAALWREEITWPDEDIVLINQNFTYGVLEDKREKWLMAVVDTCIKMGIKYVISQHPADKTDLTGLYTTHENIYDLIRQSTLTISRFSSVILESLAMGKPAVYFNPHGEKAIKFQDAMGAYEVCNSEDLLEQAINSQLAEKENTRVKAIDFLDHHCNVKSEETSSSLAASRLVEIVNSL